MGRHYLQWKRTTYCRISIQAPYNLTNFECALIIKIRSIKSRQQYIIMGDFNINYAILNSISTLTNYDNPINALGSSQLVNLPTRVTPTTSSVIDRMYVNQAALTCINPAIIQHDFFDHMLVIVEYRKTSIKKELQRPATRRFCKTSFELFLADLETRSETSKFQQSDNLLYLINLPEDLTNKYFPKIRMSRRQFKISRSPWITKGILVSIKKTNVGSVFKTKILKYVIRSIKSIGIS